MNRTILIVIGILATLLTAAGMMWYNNYTVTQISGQKTPDGRLIFHTNKYTKENTALEANQHFGMMIFYYPDISPDVRYELYLQKTGMIIKTTSLRAFLRQINQIPSGETIYFFNTCTAGSHYGLDKNIIRVIKEFCNKKNITLDEDFDFHTIETCQ